MKRSILACLFFVAGLLNSINAQSSLGIDSTNFSAPATANFNASYTFMVNVVNYGPQPFIGMVDLVYGIDTTGSMFPTYDTTNSRMVNMNIPIGTEQADSNIIPIDAHFKSGINTVVIWPRTNGNVVTHDSLKITVLVAGFAGIGNYTDPRPIVFPNPAQARLFIADRGVNSVIEQVRIMDLSGLVVLAGQFTGSIDISQLLTGSYILELRDKSGRISRHKVIKE